MENISQILFTQHLYFVAAEYLAKIGVHPNHVKQGRLGYFMTIDNIKEVVRSLNPQDWYTEEVCEGKKVALEDLPEEDRWKLTELINDLTSKSMSENHLIEKCNKCMRLSLEFGNKILQLLKEKNELRKNAMKS